MRTHATMLLLASACAGETRGLPAEESERDVDERMEWPEAGEPRPVCPESERYLSDGCKDGATCTYTNDDIYACITRHYTCTAGSWSLIVDDCHSSACPADKPQAGTSCAGEDLQCRYPGRYCPHLLSAALCDSGQWAVSEPECGSEPWNGGVGFPHEP